MLHQHFKALVNNPELRHLLLRGTCIGQREIKGYRILLFQTKDRYYEVAFDKADAAVLASWHFDDTDSLEPYLEQIEIPEFIRA